MRIPLAFVIVLVIVVRSFAVSLRPLSTVLTHEGADHPPEPLTPRHFFFQRHDALDEKRDERFGQDVERPRCDFQVFEDERVLLRLLVAERRPRWRCPPTTGRASGRAGSAACAAGSWC